MPGTEVTHMKRQNLISRDSISGGRYRHESKQLQTVLRESYEQGDRRADKRKHRTAWRYQAVA